MEPREKDVRTWSMFCHLSALAGLFFGFGNILGPLIVWQIKKNELPETNPHGKEALNFQITITIINFIAFGVFFGFWGATWGFRHFWSSPLSMLGGTFGIGAIIAIINLAAWILAVVAGVKANNGEFYKYPFAIRFIK